MKFPFTGKATLEAKIVTLESSLKTEKEASLALASEVQTLKSKIEELSKVPAVSLEAFETLTKENESLKLEVAKSIEAVTDFESKVTSKAMDIVASQGIPAVPVIPEDKTKEELLAQLVALPENKRFAFFQKHEKALTEEIVKLQPGSK